MLTDSPEDIERCCHIAERIGMLRRREFVRLVRSIAEVRTTLTDDQRARLETIKF